MKSEISIKFAHNLSDSDTDYLCKLINDVYDDAESGMWQKGAVRIKKDALVSLINNEKVILSKINNEIVGCIVVELINQTTAEFGVLAVDKIYRKLGLGNKLITAAENSALANNAKIMQLKLLTPKYWIHPSKEFLKNWYNKLGYIKTEVVPFDEDKVNFLATPCDFTVYQKKL